MDEVLEPLEPLDDRDEVTFEVQAPELAARGTEAISRKRGGESDSCSKMDAKELHRKYKACRRNNKDCWAMF